MATINFRNEDFPSLAMTQFSGKWNPVAMSELGEEEQDFMLVLLLAASDGGEVNQEDILLVRATEDGALLDRVYGPSVFLDPDTNELVLKVGGNSFPVTIEGQNFRVGSLCGPISFEKDPIKRRIKDKDGDDLEVDYYPATIDLLPDDGTDYEFCVNCALAPELEVTRSKVLQMLKKSESIVGFFNCAPKNEGGSAIKMQDLGVGEYALQSVRSIDGSYGKSFILMLESGQEVWGRGNVDIVLKSQQARIEGLLEEGQPVTLVVSKIQPRSDGKYRVDCALMLREPRESTSSATPTKTKTKTKTRQFNDNVVDKGKAKTEAKTKAKAKKAEPVAAGAGNDTGDIPF